jgi:hypothetical protein
VTVQGTTLQYTAEAGSYGEDQFTYRAEVGSATATAIVKLTVEAELELSGHVSPATNGMEVSAQVGDKQFTTTTDALGSYKLPVRSSRANAFVTLGAKGSGAKAALAMSSLVGDFGLLVSAASSQKLTETKWPALTLDALSSSRQGLLAQRGGLPSSSAALRQAIPRTHPDDLLDTVNQFRRVAEGGASLPEGVPTTLKLVSDASALAAANRKALAGTDGFTGMSATASTVADASPPAVGTQGSLLAVIGTDHLVFDLKPDGSASFFGYDQNGLPAEDVGRWAHEGDTLRISVTEMRTHGEWVYHGFQLRKIRSADTQARPELMMREHKSLRACLDCEVAWSEWKPVVSFDVQRDRLALTMADFAANTRWAGVSVPGTSGEARCLCSNASATVFDGTLSKGATKGQLAAGNLEFSGEDASTKFTQRYTRLWQGDDNIEYWLAETELNGVMTNRVLRPVVKAPQATLDAAKAARRWLIPDAPGQLNPSESAVQEILRSDGSWKSIKGNTTVSAPSYNWKLTRGGKGLVLLVNDVAQAAEYDIAAEVSGGYLAFGRKGLVRLRDLGPSD